MKTETKPGAIARRPNAEVSHGIVPKNMDELARLCQAIARSPSTNWKNEHDVLVSVQTGMELGMSPMQALTNIPVVKGRPMIMGAAALAVCRRDHAFEDGTDLEVTYTGEGKGRACHVSSHKRGRTAPCETTTFSMLDAQRAGLIRSGGAWEMYPDRMLRWRAVGWHLRDNYSEHILGLYLAEEMTSQDHALAPVTSDSETLALPAPEDDDPLLAEIVPAEGDGDPLLDARDNVTEDVVELREGLRDAVLEAVGGEIDAAKKLLREVSGAANVTELHDAEVLREAREKLRTHPVFGEE